MPYDRERAMARNVAFMSDPDITGALVRVNGFGAEGLPSVDPLETFDLPREVRRYCDQLIERFLRFYEAHERFDDDWMPALKPTFGIAEHSAFLGGEVTYGGDTSFQHPVIGDIRDWTRLRMDKNAPHYRTLLEGMAYMKERSEACGYLSALRGGDGPMDIANAVRGNDLLYDFYDEPEAVAEFMDFCVEAAAWTFKNQYPLATVVAGGYIGGMTTWMPSNSIGHLSEDASCLCSPAMYEKFGLPYTAKLLERYDYAMMHVHSLGRACIPLMARMEKIGTFQLSGDPNQPDGIDVYREYAEALKGRVVMLDMTPAQVRDNLDFLKGRKTIINVEASGPEEAEWVIDMARSL